MRELKSYLDFGDMPLVNNLCETRQCAIDMPKYPLKALFCDNCVDYLNCLKQLIKNFIQLLHL